MTELSALMIEPTDPLSYSKRLQAVLDVLPIGIVLARAPDGKIVVGNRALERMLRHPVLYSKDSHSYSEWVAFHEDGRRVESQEYPLARALSGAEIRPELECRYRRPDNTYLWIKIVGYALRNDNGDIIGGVVSVTDIDELKMAHIQERMMRRELHHRLNNALCVIQSIANMSVRTTRDVQAFRDSFADWVRSISRTHLLMVDHSWEHISIETLLTTELEIGDRGANGRITLAGDDVALRSDVALALGMAIHELKCNAKKFGALSNDEGVVAIEWRRSDAPHDGKLTLQWRESGGPPVAPPSHRGLGAELLGDTLSRQLGGSIEVDCLPQGLVARITMTP